MSYRPRLRPFLFTTPNLMDRLNLKSRGPIEAARKSGKLKWVRVGSQVRYTREAVEQWLGFALPESAPPLPASPRVQKLIDTYQTTQARDGKSASCGPDHRDFEGKGIRRGRFATTVASSELLDRWILRGRV
jgi:hypothetical protein